MAFPIDPVDIVA